MKAKPIAKNCLICNNLKGWSIKAAHNLWVKSTLTSILAARKDQLIQERYTKIKSLYYKAQKRTISTQYGQPKTQYSTIQNNSIFCERNVS